MRSDLERALNVKRKVEQSITALLSSPRKCKGIQDVVEDLTDYLAYEYPSTDTIEDYCVAYNTHPKRIDVTISVGGHYFPMSFLFSANWFLSTMEDINYIQTDEESDLVIEFEYDKPTFEMDQTIEFDWPFPTGEKSSSKRDDQQELNDAYERAKKAVSDM